MNMACIGKGGRRKAGANEKKEIATNNLNQEFLNRTPSI